MCQRDLLHKGYLHIIAIGKVERQQPGIKFTKMQKVFCFVFQKSELHILSNPVLLENSCFCTNPANIRNKAVSQVGHLLLSLKLIKLLFESFVIMHEQLQKAFNIRHCHICKKESCVGTFQNSQLSICPAKSALISTSFLKECFEACPSRLTG